MKRQSAAEIALTRQIKILDDTINAIGVSQAALKVELDSYRTIRYQLEKEVARLKAAREAASIKAKPND